VLALDLAQQQAHGVAVVAAAELELLGNELAGVLQGHVSPPVSVMHAVAVRARDRFVGGHPAEDG
jgi:hypothetical protein